MREYAYDSWQRAVTAALVLGARTSTKFRVFWNGEQWEVGACRYQEAW